VGNLCFDCKHKSKSKKEYPCTDCTYEHLKYEPPINIVKEKKTMKNLTVERIVTVELTVIDRDVKEDMSNLKSDDELSKCIRVSAKNLLNVDDAQIKSVKTFIHEPSRRKNR